MGRNEVARLALGRGVRSAPGQMTMPSMEELQCLRVLLVHPHDPDGDSILRHLRRICCQVEAMWPPPNYLPARIDVMFYLIDEITSRSLPWYANQPDCAIVAVMKRETPSAVRLLTDCSPQAVVNKPVEPFDLLTSVIAARSIFRYEERLRTKVRKLEETLRSVRKVEQAKSILMKNKNIEEQEAYEYLRKCAMDRRVPIGKVAAAVIDANDILS